MTYGDDSSLDELKRELQQMKSAQLEQSARQLKLEKELMEIRVMIESREQRRT